MTPKQKPHPMSDEAARILNFFASAGPWANTTIDEKDLKSLLLATGGNYFCAGCLYNFKATLIGAGVYKLTAEANTP